MHTWSCSGNSFANDTDHRGTTQPTHKNPTVVKFPKVMPLEQLKYTKNYTAEHTWKKLMDESYREGCTSPP